MSALRNYTGVAELYAHAFYVNVGALLVILGSRPGRCVCVCVFGGGGGGGGGRGYSDIG